MISGDGPNIWPDTETKTFPDAVVSSVLSTSCCSVSDCTFQTQRVNQSLGCKSLFNSEAQRRKRDIYLYENVTASSFSTLPPCPSPTPRFTALFIRVSMWRGRRKTGPDCITFRTLKLFSFRKYQDRKEACVVQILSQQSTATSRHSRRETAHLSVSSCLHPVRF